MSIKYLTSTITVNIIEPEGGVVIYRYETASQTTVNYFISVTKILISTEVLGMNVYSSDINSEVCSNDHNREKKKETLYQFVSNFVSNKTLCINLSFIESFTQEICSKMPLHAVMKQVNYL